MFDETAMIEAKRFVPIPGAKHDWLLEYAQSQQAVEAFLRTF